MSESEQKGISKRGFIVLIFALSLAVQGLIAGLAVSVLQIKENEDWGYFIIFLVMVLPGMAIVGDAIHRLSKGMRELKVSQENFLKVKEEIEESKGI